MARIAGMLLLLVSTWCGAPAQERPGWLVDPGREELRLVVPGGSPTRVLRLRGGPWQVRADLGGRAVVPAGQRPGAWLIDEGGAIFRPTEGPVLDAVPDGRGGAVLAIGGASGGLVQHLDRRGTRRRRLRLAVPARHVRRLADGDLLLVQRSGPGVVALRRIDAVTGTVRASFFLPAMPREVVLDDHGRIWLPGAVGGAVPVVDEWLQPVGLWPAFAARDVAPARGGSVALLAGSPAGVSFLGGSVAGPPVVLPGASSLSPMPDGSVLVLDGSGTAHRVEPGGSVVWVGPWSGSYAANDGGGLEEARWGGAARDPDGDGWPSRCELLRGDDPGDPRRAPLLILPGPGAETLTIRAPAHPLAAYALVAGDRVLEGPRPLALEPASILTASMVPGRVFDAPAGQLDSGGEARIRWVAGPARSLWVVAGLVDPALTGGWLVGPATRVASL